MTEIAFALTANNRPEYLGPTLDSWARALEFAGAKLVKARLLIEPGPKAEECLEIARQHEWIYASVNYARLGVTWNPHTALESAANGLGDDVLLISADEDVVVAKDAVRCLISQRELAQVHMGEPAATSAVHMLGHLWELPLTEYLEPSKDDVCAEYVVQTNWFWPWGWAVDVGLWRKIALLWDNGPECWDAWFLKSIAPALGLLFTVPATSRANHFGRYGEHMTEYWADIAQAPTFDPDLDASEFCWGGYVAVDGDGMTGIRG